MKIIFTCAKAVATVFLILGALSFVTCGGGGGDGGGGAPPPSATVNTTTAPQIASAIGTIMTGVTSALAPLAMDTGSGIYSPKSLLRHADPLVFQKGRTLAGSLPGTPEPCTDGGSRTLNVTWDGPDNPQSCDEVSNPRLEFVFAGCQEGTETLDGTMVMSTPGDLCDDTPSSISVTLSNLRYQDSAAATDVTFNLSMNLTNIQYDQYARIASMTVAVSGSIAGTSDGTAMNVTYQNYSLACSGIQYDINEDIVGITAIINGRFYGTLEGDQLDEQYDGLTFTSEQATQDSTDGMLVAISGRYWGACFDGWVTFDTLTTIFIPDGSSCPTSGQVRISGNGEATITYNADGSVDIDVGGNVQQYAPCDALPACSVP